MNGAYVEYCNDLWRQWLDGTLQVPQALHRTFDLGAAPEPFILFEGQANALVTLTTNPGSSMPHQRRHAVAEGTGPLNERMDYLQAARSLGDFYMNHLTGPARQRVAALMRLSSLLGFDGVLQVEGCPFHSPTFPSTSAFVRLVERVGVLGTYTEHLRAFLRTRAVLIVSAVSTGDTLSVPARLSPWARWQADLAALDIDRAVFVPLVSKGARTTAAALVSETAGTPKAMVLMMGGNRLPAEQGLRLLAGALRVRYLPP